ncbi:MAG: hydantoinase B/oxoprolinase family protein [Hyphomicrobiaceae bacterium]
MVDPVTMEVVRSSLIDITREMTAVVMRSAPTTLWKESGDLSCGILNWKCELIAQGPNDLPAHLATMPFSARGALEAITEELHPGDVIFHNDPCAGNNHLPDCLMLMPVFDSGTLLAFTAVRGHWADIGGIGLGSYTTLTTDSIQEGLRVPPVRIFKRGVLDEEMLSIILANVRGSELRRSDFLAQYMGCARGGARIGDLCAKYGGTLIRECMTAILDHGERLTRAEIERIPDGRYEFEDGYDGDGVDDVRLRVKVAVTVKDSDVHVDLTGSSPQATGGMNAPFAVTNSAVQFAIKAITDPWNPPNGGSYRPITVTAPRGCMFNPVLPAPVIGCNSEVGIILSDTVLGALAKACPERVTAAGCGSGVIVVVGGKHADGGMFHFMEALGSAGGARSDADGWDAYRVGVGNMGITSLEIIESESPIRTVAYELATGWGGRGRHRGGIPGRHVFELLSKATVTITAERSVVPAFGLDGGGPGRVAEFVLNPGRPDEKRLFSKTPPMNLAAGTVVSITPAGGGGFGSPAERSDHDSRRDQREGYL